MILGPTKPCRGCDTVYLATPEFFVRHSGLSMGLNNRCKKCRRAYHRNRYHNGGGKARQRNSMLKHRYGISTEDFNRMAADQDGGCAICGKWSAQLFVDHCHQSGIVRGLLCSGCNGAIGVLGDSPDGLSRALDYLARASSGAAAA
jgi:hypothetical protein